MSVHLAKGTRDHLPDSMRHRLVVIDRLRAVFERHGFAPLDTPAFERIETLMGKYGDEGSKLTFKILKRGKGGERGECDLALRYDLTVPLARVAAMNPGLRMPFKRWHIAPVWRAERPARGRFREFVQCDVDIVGAEGISAEAECLATAADAYRALGLSDWRLRVNDRRLLAAMARAAGAADRETDLLVAVDKLDKIGRDGVTAELQGKGFDEASIATVWRLLQVDTSDPAVVLAHLEQHLQGDDVAAALADLRALLPLTEALGVPSERLVIDPTLARGLDYYTGPVFEAELTEGGIGSVGGGGRYDGLIGMFGKNDVPAVGFSVGLERLLVVLEERGELPASEHPVDACVTVFDDAHRLHSARAAARLRQAGLSVEMILAPSKLGKQFKHADAVGARFAITIGPDDASAGMWSLKDLKTGQRTQLSPDDAVAHVSGTVRQDS
jgi:histidyl-tRNA synthetase